MEKKMKTGIDFNQIYDKIDIMENMAVESARLVANGRYSEARRTRKEIYAESLRTLSTFFKEEHVYAADKIVVNKLKEILKKSITRGIGLDLKLDFMATKSPIENVLAAHFADIKAAIFRGDLDEATDSTHSLYEDLFGIREVTKKNIKLRKYLGSVLESLTEAGQRI